MVLKDAAKNMPKWLRNINSNISNGYMIWLKVGESAKSGIRYSETKKQPIY